MSYTLPSDVDDRPIAIDGAGTLGRRIGTVYAAGGTDTRIFDVSQAQREAARDYVYEQIDHVRSTLKPAGSRAGEVALFDVTDRFRARLRADDVVATGLEHDVEREEVRVVVVDDEDWDTRFWL